MPNKEISELVVFFSRIPFFCDLSSENFEIWLKIVSNSNYSDQEIPQSQTADKHTTINWHQENKQSKATSLISFPPRWLQN